MNYNCSSCGVGMDTVPFVFQNDQFSDKYDVILLAWCGYCMNIEWETDVVTIMPGEQ